MARITLVFTKKKEILKKLANKENKMKKILIYLPAKIFTALQESLNAIPIEYDLKSFGESLPLLVLDKLRSNDVNINTSLNYQCLTIDFSSQSVVEKV